MYGTKGIEDIENYMIPTDEESCTGYRPNNTLLVLEGTVDGKVMDVRLPAYMFVLSSGKRPLTGFSQQHVGDRVRYLGSDEPEISDIFRECGIEQGKAYEIRRIIKE